MGGEGDQPATRGSERPGVYRRRLAVAAVASVALHMILARGLAVSHLGSHVPNQADAGKEPLKPKRKAADFPLQVSPSREQQRPAHERPLDIAARPPESRPVERPREPAPRQPLERPAEPAEPTEQPEVATADLERTRSEAASDPAAPARQATAEASEAATPAVDTAAIDAARAAEPAAQPAAATLEQRDQPPAAAVASRWRPREVELLERLASRPPTASRVTRMQADEPDASPVADRRGPTDPGSATAAKADTIATPAADPSAAQGPSAATVAAAARRTAPSSATAAAARSADTPDTAAPARTTATLTAPSRSAQPGADAAVAAARPTVTTSGPSATAQTVDVGTPAATASPAAAAPAAAAVSTASRGGRPAAASGRPSGAARAGAAAGAAAADGEATAPATASTAAVGGGGWGPSRTAARGRGTAAGDGPTTPARAATTGGSTAGGSGKADTIATAAPPGGDGGAPQGGGTAPAAGSLAALPGPAAVSRAGSGVGRGGGRSAVGESRRGAAAEADGEDEGLSVSVADAGSGIAATPRRRSPDDDAALPGRIAASALPVEGRVRDVAEAFAKRTTGGEPGDRGGKVADRDVVKRAETLVDRGLDFLARSQRPDGRWSLGAFAGSGAADVPKLESDTAATGLALLSFLGAGHDHFDGRHRDTVRRGLEFLMAIQKPDGDLFLPADDLSNSCAWLYSHGIAAMAVCEAVGMTGDPLVKPAAEKACRFIAASQHPQLGGWRYTPRSDADLSVSGWMLVAIRAGELAGVKTDAATLPGVRRLVEAAASRDDATRYAYNPRKEDQRRSRLSLACMTAVGGLMRLHTGDPPTDPRVIAAGRAVAAVEPAYGTASEKVRDAYLWYYASQVLVHTGGPDWNRWYGKLVDTLAARQETRGEKAGSWDPVAPVPDRWGEYGGRIYVTALHLLALEVPDRHLPTYGSAGKAAPRP